MTWLRGAALLLAFALAAIVMFPLRMAWAAAPPAGLGVAGIHGTIWAGRLTGVSWRGADLGDFDVSMSPFDLLPAPALRLTNGTGVLKQAVLRGAGDRIDIADAELTFPLAALSPLAPPDLAAQINGGAVTLADGQCTSAAGKIALPAAPSLGLPAFNGALACDKGLILAQLESTAGNLMLELSSGFERISVRSASPPLELALGAIGIPVVASRS